MGGEIGGILGRMILYNPPLVCILCDTNDSLGEGRQVTGLRKDLGEMGVSRI